MVLEIKNYCEQKGNDNMKSLKKLLSLVMVTTSLLAGGIISTNASSNLPSVLFRKTDWIQPVFKAITIEHIETEIDLENNEKIQLKAVFELPLSHKAYASHVKDVIVEAVKKLYKAGCNVKTDDIQIQFIGTNSLASYTTLLNLIYCPVKLLASHNFFINSLAHELMHKYVFENLGYTPLWFDEALATQMEEDFYCHTIMPFVNDLHGFFFATTYPANNDNFYKFNYIFMKTWLKENGISIKELVAQLQPLVKGKTIEQATDILCDYFLNNKGKEILEKNGYKFAPQKPALTFYNQPTKENVEISSKKPQIKAEKEESMEEKSKKEAKTEEKKEDSVDKKK